MKPKSVKILYKTISKYQWSKKVEDKNSPFLEIETLFKYIKKRPKKKKFRDIQGDKFCFLENFSVDDDKHRNRTIIKGFFKSARNQFRPNLINKKTGTERPNPKLLVEGDIERTHFAIIIDRKQNEVFMLLEYNFHGLTMNNIMDYLNFFNRKYLGSKNLPKNYKLHYFTIPKTGFLEALKSMKSAKIADVYFDKKLLGSEALKFSNRLIGVKNELKLTIGSERGESLKETAVDLFNTFNSGESSISKVRISGKDEQDNDIMIDTSFMNKMDYLKIDRNELTGDLNTTQLYSKLANLINAI